MTARFLLGQVVATPAALAVLAASGQSAAEFVERHLAGDWGEVSAEDARLNEQALADGARLLSVYQTRNGDSVWIITDAEDDCGQRQATTLLLPEDY